MSALRLAPVLALVLVVGLPLATAATVGTRERGYDLQFDPERLEVGPGEEVTFTSSGAFAHTLTSIDGAFDTGNKPPGEERSFRAPEAPGEYPFVCSYHEQMRGVLVVRAAASGAASGESPGPPAEARGTPGAPLALGLALLASAALAVRRRGVR